MLDVCYWQTESSQAVRQTILDVLQGFAESKVMTVEMSKEDGVPFVEINLDPPARGKSKYYMTPALALRMGFALNEALGKEVRFRGLFPDGVIFVINDAFACKDPDQFSEQRALDYGMGLKEMARVWGVEKGVHHPK